MYTTDLKLDIDYFTERRDDALEHFNDKVKQYGLYGDEDLYKALDTVLKVSKQLKVAEDTAIVFTIIQNNNANK